MVSSSSGGGVGGGVGVGGRCPQLAVRKGPWTMAEDAILIEFVRKHGEGNWNAVQKNCGLLRCGKSCRQRWANHLRPNLKKGAFTPEEEKTIIDLHATVGNKWARIASKLSGRTDNKIKNYWNARVKRFQRTGLPSHPENISQRYDQPQPQPPQLQLQQQPPPPRILNCFSPSFSALLSSSSSPSPSFSSILSSSTPSSSHDSNTKLNSPLSFPPTNPLQPTQPYSFLSNPNPQFNPSFNPHGFVPPGTEMDLSSLQFNSGNGFDMVSSPPPPTTTTTMAASFNTHGFVPLGTEIDLSSLQFNSGNGFDMISSPPPSTTTMAASFNPHGFVPPGTEIDLSSLQFNSGNGFDMISSPPPSTTTMAASFNPHGFVPPGTEIDLSSLQFNSGNGFDMISSPPPSTTTMAASFNPHGFVPPGTEIDLSSLQFNSGNGFDMISSLPPPKTTTMAASFNPHGFVPPGTEIDLSSLQFPVPGLGLGTTTTPAYSGSTVRGGGGDGDGDGMIETTHTISLIPNAQAVNSGLLDALLDESKALAQIQKLKNEISSAEAARKGKWICVSEDAAKVVYDSSSGYSSIGMKKNEPWEELFDIDEDLSSLLNNFPMTVPDPDWYNAIGTSSFGLNNLPEASPSAVANTTETTNPGQARSSCCWKNIHDKF